MSRAESWCEPAHAVIFDEAASSSCWDGAQVLCTAHLNISSWQAIRCSCVPSNLHDVKDTEYTISFMERLMRCHDGNFLDAQYRMHHIQEFGVPGGLRTCQQKVVDRRHEEAPPEGCVKWVNVESATNKREMTVGAAAEPAYRRTSVRTLPERASVWVLSF